MPRPNSYLPDPADLAAFAKAAALRYSGRFGGLPWVRYWQGWNEPNLSLYLIPQLEQGRPISPAHYRRMLNAFAAAVRSVNRQNVVIAGGLAPFRDITPYVLKQNKDWGPLSFMRALLCLSPKLKPTCSQRVSFDVWAQHPYTSGGPLHHAQLANDVSLGDLPKVRRTLRAAVAAGHVDSRGQVGFWVTEFTWDSRPPDPEGVPISLLDRWVAEALYRMWQNGVTVVTWLALRDQPLSTSYYQSGLYFFGGKAGAGRPKPFLRAFRFPVVAFPARSGISVWGRTPAGEAGKVTLQRRVRGRWSLLGTLFTDRFGIFQRRFQRPPVGFVRARFAGSGEYSLPFSLKPVRDRFFNPFGLPTLLEPKP